MLEDLDNINWSIYQAPVDVPQLLRDLASDNDQKWQNAFYELADRVVMNRTLLGTGPTRYIYEVLGTDLLSVITPFLLELLKYPDIKSKPAILDLLDSMVSYREIFVLQEPYQSRAERIPQYICPEIDTLMVLLNRDHSYEVQTRIIRLLIICAIEVCNHNKSIHIFEMLIDHIDRSIQLDSLSYLLEEIADGLKKPGTPVNLQQKYLKKLNNLHATSNDAEIRTLAIKLKSEFLS